MNPDTPVPRRAFQRAVRFLGVVTFAALVFAAFSFYKAHSTGVDRTARLCGVIRDVLIDARDQTLQQARPGKERDQAVRFYQRHLAALEALPCEHNVTKGATP